MQKLWFSIFNIGAEYKGDEPAFLSPENFNWSAELAANTGQIKAELIAYLQKNNLAGYFNTNMVSQANAWKTIALKTWDIQLYKNQEQFPFTTALLKKYPEILSASFNLLEPGAKILPHCGDTNAIYRCHLGLEIPAKAPECAFRVKDEVRSWEQGKWLIFPDAYMHEAWNHTGKERYIFLIDVLRKEFKAEKNKVTSTVITSLFLQKRAVKYKLLSGIRSGAIINATTKTLRPFAFAAIKTCNFLKIY